MPDLREWVGNIGGTLDEFREVAGSALLAEGFVLYVMVSILKSRPCYLTGVLYSTVVPGSCPGEQAGGRVLNCNFLRTLVLMALYRRLWP